VRATQNFGYFFFFGRFHRRVRSLALLLGGLGHVAAAALRHDLEFDLEFERRGGRSKQR
jgi:hypothetical protein